MIRVLFTDDEPRVLDALAARLRRHRDEWDMVFATSGAQAIEELERRPFDVLVTDLRMPDVDGPALLRHVEAHHAHVVRVVLSGQVDEDEALRIAPLVHQWLTKPAQTDEIARVLGRAAELRTRIGNDVVRRLVGRVRHLPAMPRTYAQLARLARDERVGMHEIAHVIERDVAIAAKVLQLANSAFLGVGRALTSVREAIIYLGLDTVRTVALSLELHAAARRLAPERARELHRHATAVASLAARIAGEGAAARDAFTAGMLHDAGALVLAAELGDAYGAIVAEARATRRALVTVEAERLGVTHADVGAYLLGLWGLPSGVVEAIAAHHGAPTRATLGGVLALADALVREDDGEATDVDLGASAPKETLAAWRGAAAGLRAA